MDKKKAGNSERTAGGRQVDRAYRAGVKFGALRMAKAVYHNWDMAATRGTATRKNDSIYIAAIIRPE
jgi:hypothetical protein